jgi:hypothetical protein
MLYDEGMYPSGSSSGQVVAHDPTLAARCLAKLEESDAVPAGAGVVARVKGADGKPITIIDRRADSFIRGLHYQSEDGTIEDEPPAGDILNPRTAQLVLRLVHERFFEWFASHFGQTIIGIFTDEPSPLGRPREKSIWPGTTGILEQVNRLLGYDFTPHLAALWEQTPESEKYRADYDWAIHRRLEETWYRPLSEWCTAHGVALCGHPDRGDEIGVQRFFTIPGQDLVWRWVLPDHPSALEGEQSTQAKATSSAMIHLGRRFNSNEFCGAYGHETTFEEFAWLANWCFVRGVNLLIPHAFYYSVRGPRRDERPPQVGGVGCSWWDRFGPFADHCRSLSWLNTDCGQRDFNYLETALLEKVAEVDNDGIHIAGISYRLLIVDGTISQGHVIRSKLALLESAGRVIHFDAFQSEDSLISAIDAACPADVRLASPAPSLRVRHVIKEGLHYYFFFNECSTRVATTVTVSAQGSYTWIDTMTRFADAASQPLKIDLAGWSSILLQVE